MTKLASVLVVFMLLAACVETPRPPIGSGPFVGLDLSKMSASDRQTLQEASDDFRAVVAGKKPPHAIFDESAGLPADGGTTFYKGHGYELTILISLSNFGGQDTHAYGPIIKFDPKFAPGNTTEISDIRVYTREEFSNFFGR